MTYKPKGGKWPESMILCILRLLVTSHDPSPFLPCNKLHRGTMLYALQTEGGEGVFVNSDSVPETSKGVTFINVEGYHISYPQYIVPQDRHCTGVYAV